MDGLRGCHTEWNKSDREGEMSYDIPYMWNLKRNDTNKLTYKTKETHKLREWNYGCPWLKAGGTDSWGVWDGHVQAARFKMDNRERRPTVQHMELCSVLYGSPDGRGFVCLFVFEGVGNGYMYMHGWVPSLFIWNYYNSVNWSYPNTKQKVERLRKEEERWTFGVQLGLLGGCLSSAQCSPLHMGAWASSYHGGWVSRVSYSCSENLAVNLLNLLKSVNSATFTCPTNLRATLSREEIDVIFE